MKDNISFSSDNGKISKEDLDETSKISKKYFKNGKVSESNPNNF